MVQWVEQKSPCQAASSHLASKIFALNGVGEVVPSGLRMRVKNPLKKNFMLFLREMAGLGDLFAPLLSDFADGSTSALAQTPTFSG